MSQRDNTHGQNPTGGRLPGGPVPGGMLTEHIQLNRQLGAGGMGVVWHATDARRNYQVAVKFLADDLKQVRAEQQRFKDVFSVVSGLQHQHICPLYDSGIHATHGPWVLMKYIHGLNMAQYRQWSLSSRGEVPVTEMLEILRQTADALDYAHNPSSVHLGHGRGVIHRDIKPGNILITSDPDSVNVCVQIVDFGLAAAISDVSGRVNSSLVYGTPAYMSPEQREAKKQDRRTDVYSLGVVAYELLSHHRPFADGAAVGPETQPIKLHGLAETELVFRKVLAYEPTERYSTCREFVEALQATLEGIRGLPGEGRSPVVGLQTGWIAPDIPFGPALRETIGSVEGTTARHPPTLTAAYKEATEAHTRIQTDLQNVDNELEQLQGTVKLGIVGTRNAGKTSWYASWYLFRNDAQFNIDLTARNETLDYLQRVAGELLATGSTSATAVSTPDSLTFQVAAEHRQWNVETIDFSGELLNPQMRQDKALAATTHDFLKSCDLVIFLHDLEDTSIDIINAIDNVFDGPIRDVVLVLTKFDRLGYDRTADPDFRPWFRKQLKTHRVLSSLYTKVRTSYSRNRVTVVPVSATGRQLSDPGDNEFTVDDLSPFQIFVPLMLGFRRRRERIEAAEKRKLQLQRQLAEIEPKVNRLQDKVDHREAEREAAVRKADSKLDNARKRSTQLLGRSPLPVRQLKDLARICERLNDKFRKLSDHDRAAQSSTLADRINDALINAVPIELRQQLDKLHTAIHSAEFLQFVDINRQVRRDLGLVTARCESEGLSELSERCEQAAGDFRVRYRKMVVIPTAALLGILALLAIVLYFVG